MGLAHKDWGRGEAGREEEEEGGGRKARRVDRRGPRAVENKFGTFFFKYSFKDSKIKLGCNYHCILFINKQRQTYRGLVWAAA